MVDYELLNKQLLAISSDDEYLISFLANTSALLYDNLPDLNWLGFYLLKNNELILGPFQGKVACLKIEIGKGVCGTAVFEKKVIRVDNVHEFKGHIACDSASNSEIVLPIFKDEEVFGVLDIDSPSFNRFKEEDEKGLKTIVASIEKILNKQLL